LENMSISASIVTYNDSEKSLKAVKSILDNTKKYPLNLYVFDNGSTDDTVKVIKDNTTAAVIENKENLGFGKAHNLSLKQEMGKYHFFINPDISVTYDVLSEMADFLEDNPDIVMAMPKILNEDGTEQKLPKEVPTFKRLFLGRLNKDIRSEYVWANREISNVTDIDFCSGCFFCVRSDVLKKLGGFDEKFFMYLEDADMTLRAKKYGRVVIAPQFFVTHAWERASAKKLKYLLIHIKSSIMFLSKGRENI